MALKNPFTKIKEIKDKNRAAEVVVAAESMSPATGIPAIDIIKKVSKKIKNVYFDDILKKYNKGEPKSKIYSKLFDNIFLNILEIAEKKSIEVSGVFQAYMDTREKLKKAKGKIASAIVEPFITYFIVSAISFFSLTNIIKNKSIFQSMKIDISLLSFVYNFFWLIILGIAFVILFVLFKLQRRIPFLKEAHKEMDTYNYLSVINIMLRSGIPSTDISTLFGMKKKGSEGIALFFKKLLKVEELVVLQMGMESYQYEQIIEVLLKRRESKFESRIDGIANSLRQVLFLISMIPIAITLTSIFMIVVKVMKASSTI